MVFSSNIFLFIFLPLTLCGYYLLNQKFRNSFLLLASLFFYFWGDPKFILIMIVSIVLNYIFGLLIYYSQHKRINNKIKKLILFLAIISNLGLLFYFKYLDFSIELLNQLFNMNISLKNIALPIGISFFTFQGMTYIIDLYWEKVTVQKNPLKIALYISLFPQLIAGPIVRYQDVNEQIDNRKVSIEKFSEGIKRFVLGLGKKTIIANTVAFVADNIFNQPYNENTLVTAWVGALCYALQIYFDFSGYSDMAIGLGKMFGFDFLENFSYPYISKSITDFWRRWHISLSTFFRDYLYIPLGGNRKGNVYVNLFIVFFMTGLWHGASLNFIVWGLWHGIFMLLERITRNSSLLKFKIPIIIKHTYTLLIVIIGWVFFRAETLEYALAYLGVMFGIVKPVNIGYDVMYYLDNFAIFIIIIAIIAATGVLSYLANKIEKKHSNQPLFNCVKLVYISLLMVICVIFVMASTYNPFIYFRF
ncbi:alginate O-acetylation protein [Anaerocolumna cellulosilytica]|uniref:Alginate O-acetylation protein n=1 Tax=Anaerocolumna cellulosilytica TaxID=433286 RepID=A0A6S6R1C0_9FIRM|nr:MBOAT family protein [Anaerocolumna cellulosilytica]MBB5194440.1 alginate O-acetyltransferase complex protein AlgI [Anaerocolumna cellulosilytica]BCJ93385.1 alginate O-acetylation protein [Anaerocolumna cellulosilytica]